MSRSHPFRRIVLLAGLFLLPACAASMSSGLGASPDATTASPSLSARRASNAHRSQAIDPYDDAFREHSWLCTLCPAAPPERYPDGCAAGQTGFALRFRPDYVTNPRPVILVPAHDLTVGYEASHAQPVPKFLSNRTFEFEDYIGGKRISVSMTVQSDWVSFCSRSMDEVDPSDKKETPRAGP